MRFLKARGQAARTVQTPCRESGWGGLCPGRGPRALARERAPVQGPPRAPSPPEGTLARWSNGDRISPVLLVMENRGTHPGRSRATDMASERKEGNPTAGRDKRPFDDRVEKVIIAPTQ